MGIFDADTDPDNKFPGISQWAVKDAVQRIKREEDAKRAKQEYNDFVKMEELLGPAGNHGCSYDDLVDAFSVIDSGHIADMVLTNNLISDGYASTRDEGLSTMTFAEKCSKYLGLTEDETQALKRMIIKEIEEDEKS